MIFKDVYTNTTDSEAGKVVLSDDAFAIGELLDEIRHQLNITRLKNG